MNNILEIKEEKKEPERPRYCEFRVGNERFYIDIDSLREVTELSNVFPVPQAPDYIHGLIALRGNIIPVIDLSRIYNIPPQETGSAKLIIVEAMREYLGFISDELPRFLKEGSEIPRDRFIDINDFFERYRIKEE